jgi:hypothetical protein
VRWPGLDQELTTMFEPRLDRPDDFYEALLDSHQGLSPEQSHAFNARLVLILANEVGRLDTLKAALAAAREGIDP